MMTEEELKRFRDYASHYQGSDVFFLMKHIDGQANQIATLTAALTKERMKYDLLFPEMWSAEDKMYAAKIAYERLAQELPDIFGGKE